LKNFFIENLISLKTLDFKKISLDYNINFNNENCLVENPLILLNQQLPVLFLKNDVFLDRNFLELYLNKKVLQKNFQLYKKFFYRVEIKKKFIFLKKIKKSFFNRNIKKLFYELYFGNLFLKKLKKIVYSSTFFTNTFYIFKKKNFLENVSKQLPFLNQL